MMFDLLFDGCQQRLEVGDLLRGRCLGTEGNLSRTEYTVLEVEFFDEVLHGAQLIKLGDDVGLFVQRKDQQSAKVQMTQMKIELRKGRVDIKLDETEEVKSYVRVCNVLGANKARIGYGEQ